MMLLLLLYLGAWRAARGQPACKPRTGGSVIVPIRAVFCLLAAMGRRRLEQQVAELVNPHKQVRTFYLTLVQKWKYHKNQILMH
ncbi:hypothetical protein KIF53_07120 [Chromobacterium subtsugae]|uniref:Secreted protein n=1 Tax=Chromobacterium subtsugae TaxID=251747 RepID=A0ABS7FDL2_9NEIS|nr:MULTISPECIES: hypothetical protein [Chromobacterium]MBW7569055.1 hypothetical protein [Chromobacterium subtsugae]MBW8287398.1 hypothetical protein [Chromobacterium subtsugae]WSE93357.1 hypothetical protein U6115_08995 [Chromobacterium subtsugae]WVH61735.1 hypothetical protein U6151_09015 [Chromobacterium subtsugae]